MHRTSFGPTKTSLENGSGAAAAVDILSEGDFRRALLLEQRRVERSRRSFILALVKLSGSMNRRETQSCLDKVMLALGHRVRVTDVLGWQSQGAAIGIIFTEVEQADSPAVHSAILARISDGLAGCLRIEQLAEILLSLHVYPDDWSSSDTNDAEPGRTALYPVSHIKSGRLTTLTAKRLLDVCGSLCGLIVLAPLLGSIVVAIKLTSRGPAIFRQQRVGQFGRRFTFYKFRSMYSDNDASAHRDYVTRFISGSDDIDQKEGDSEEAPLYKLANDPRITPLGHLLRRSSLDELPQLFNVLKGDMSLVGPRPPLPYEVDTYESWHRRRLVDVKPGITGFWQVFGRSRVGFAEMVRLDLAYAGSCSLWTDLKVLLRTPWAVINGEGAR